VAHLDPQHRGRRLNPRPAPSRFGTASLAVLLLGCVTEEPAPIQVSIGPTPGETRSFAPKTALAEILDLSPARTELRLILADYEASCDRFVPPADGQTYVSVLVVTPAAAALAPVSYSWLGHEAHGSTPGRPDRPFALPKAQLGRRSALLPPGGAVRLTKVGMERDGYVEGLLEFQFAGDAKRPATRLMGPFRARICKTNQAPKP
jgi:hypothetical protein